MFFVRAFSEKAHQMDGMEHAGWPQSEENSRAKNVAAVPAVVLALHQVEFHAALVAPATVGARVSKKTQFAKLRRDAL